MSRALVAALAHLFPAPSKVEAVERELLRTHAAVDAPVVRAARELLAAQGRLREAIRAADAAPAPPETFPWQDRKDIA